MEESIKNGHNLLGLMFGSNYTECMFDRMADGLDAENETLSCSSISSYANTTEFVKLWTFVMMFLKQFKNSLTSFGDRIGISSEMFQQPIKFYTMRNDEVKLEYRGDRYMISGLVC